MAEVSKCLICLCYCAHYMSLLLLGRFKLILCSNTAVKPSIRVSVQPNILYPGRNSAVSGDSSTKDKRLKVSH